MASDDEFRRLFEAHYNSVYRFFERRGFPEALAQELAQETFLRVYKGMEHFRSEASPQTWIFRIATNLFSNVLRSERAKGRDYEQSGIRAPDPGEGRSGLLDVIDPNAGPLEQAQEGELRRRLDSAVVKLPPRMRQVITLRIVHELNYREIATVLGLAVDSVKTLLYQAKRRLAQDLGEIRQSPETRNPPPDDLA